MLAHGIKQFTSCPPITSIEIVTHISDQTQVHQGTRYLATDSSCPIRYFQQDNYEGIGAAMLAVKKSPAAVDMLGCAVLLGDNLFSEPLGDYIDYWLNELHGDGAFCLLSHQPREIRMKSGVAVLDDDGKIKEFIEKPDDPSISKFVVTGFYCFDWLIWTFLGSIDKSARGEYEVTDILGKYKEYGKLNHLIYKGGWMDCGTLDDYEIAQTFFKPTI